MKAKVIMRRVNFTEKLTLYVNLRNSMRPEVYLNLIFFFFIVWKPQDFPKTMNIREGLEIFPFMSVTRELIFLKFVVGQQYLTGPPSGQISSNEFTEGMRFNML